MPGSPLDLTGLSISAEDFLSAVLDGAAQPIWAVDHGGVIRFANAAAAATLGYDTVGELVGRDSHATIHHSRSDGAPYAPAECPVLRSRATGATVASDLEWFFRRDGSMLPVSYVSAPIELREGRGAVVTFTVIDERLQAEAELARLADEQAALRRVATLVARESSPAEVFAAVAEEVGRILRVEDTTIFRFEDDWTATVVADRGHREVPLPIGSRMRLDGESATALVRRTGRPARVDDFSNATGPLADYTREAGIGSTVGSPIVVDGRLWGAMIAATRTDEPMPPATESRIGQFTELVATAISNMQARSDLSASRARIVAAADEERRRVVRDLHDGAQQRLVHTILTLKLAQRALQPEREPVSELVAEALVQAEQATAELRELARGILPEILTRGGLQAAVEALAARTSVPVELDVSVDRLPAAIEATAYFVVAEALTNVTKHAHAHAATVTARVEQGALRLRVRDDGDGGARRDGSGLVGLADRLAAVDGRLRIESPANGGTLVAADIPVPG